MGAGHPGAGVSPGPEDSAWTATGGQQADPSGAGATDTTQPSLAEAVAEESFAEAAGVPATEPEAVEESPLQTLERERDELKDRLLRLHADFENYKKRIAKQSDELRDRAAESLVEKLLPVLDTADLAVAHGGGEEVQQLAAALQSALEKEGLERIAAPGDVFDPNLHDAVAHEPSDGDIQEVAEVMRAGYRWRGRVLRAAMVKVRG